MKRHHSTCCERLCTRDSLSDDGHWAIASAWMASSINSKMNDVIDNAKFLIQHSKGCHTCRVVGRRKIKLLLSAMHRMSIKVINE